jgi:hypothetical protein
MNAEVHLLGFVDFKSTKKSIFIFPHYNYFLFQLLVISLSIIT